MRPLALALLLPSVASAGTLYVVDANSSTLNAFDTRARSLTPIGPLGVTFDFGALAWDPNHNVMFMTPGRTDQGLYTVNLRTGRATLVGYHNLGDVFALAYDPDQDVLWGGSGSGNQLFQIDPATGQGRVVTNNMGARASGGDWDPFFGGFVFNNLASTDFYVFDPATQQVSPIGAAGTYANDGGTAYDPDTELYWFFDWSGTVQAFDPFANFAQVFTTAIGGAWDGVEGTAAWAAQGHPRLQISGACPGAATIQVQGASPNTAVAIAYGGSAGAFQIRGGNCRGTFVQLDSPRLATTIQSNANGVASAQVNLPAGACGQSVQAVDLSSCGGSNLVHP